MKQIAKAFLFISLLSLSVSAQNTKALSISVSEPFLLPPFPAVSAKLPEDSVTMGDWRTFPEMKLDIPIAIGPFEPTWESIEKNYPGEPLGFVKRRWASGSTSAHNPQHPAYLKLINHSL